MVFCVLWTGGCTSTLFSRGGVRIKDEATFQDPALVTGAVQETLQGRAVVSFSTHGGKETRGKAALLVKGPDKVRIEIFGPFGQVAAVLVSDARGLSIFSNHESTFFSRREEAPFSFTPDELAGFIMGVYAQEPKGGGGGEGGEGGEGGSGGAADGYTIERDSAGDIQEIFVYSRASNGRSIVMKDFRPLQGVWFPFSVSVEDANARLYIRYSSVELNLDLDDALFIHLVPGSLKGDK